MIVVQPSTPSPSEGTKLRATTPSGQRHVRTRGVSTTFSVPLRRRALFTRRSIFASAFLISLVLCVFSTPLVTLEIGNKQEVGGNKGHSLRLSLPMIPQKRKSNFLISYRTHFRTCPRRFYDTKRDIIPPCTILIGQMAQVCGDVSVLALQPDRGVRSERRPVEPAISVRRGDLLLQSGET